MEKLARKKCGLTRSSFANIKDDDLLQIHKIMQRQEMTGLGFANTKDDALLQIHKMMICCKYTRLPKYRK